MFGIAKKNAKDRLLSGTQRLCWTGQETAVLGRSTIARRPPVYPGVFCADPAISGNSTNEKASLFWSNPTGSHSCVSEAFH